MTTCYTDQWPPAVGDHLPITTYNVSTSHVAFNQLASIVESCKMQDYPLKNQTKPQILQFLWWPKTGFSFGFLYHHCNCSESGLQLTLNIRPVLELIPFNIVCWSERDMRKHMRVKHWTLNKKGMRGQHHPLMSPDPRSTFTLYLSERKVTHTCWASCV